MDAGTPLSNKAVYLDDDSDIDYLGRLPPPTKNYDQTDSSEEASGDECNELSSNETLYQQSSRLSTKKPNSNNQKSENLAEISGCQEPTMIARLAFERYE